MKCNKEFENSINSHMQLNTIYYEYNIDLYNPLLSRFELAILTVLSVCLVFELLRNDFIVTVNCQIVYSVIFLVLLILFLRKIFWGVKKESVFIIKSLGLQTTVTYCSNFKSAKFVPWHLIDDVIINEAILMQRVIYYLAVLVKKEDGSGDCQQRSILPLFINARPRLATLEDIYSNIQGFLVN